ncbi:MAG: DUF1800 family protein [Bacteroidetes bacterium]|nr:DUF1800 family protein [Bacteroidota bacterium]
MQEHNNLLRTHALGNFKDMLLAVAKDPAMLIYLNNQQNKKAHPNENFARELLELFTLGEGNYTETDVKEAARAFTGWATNTKGQYVFNEHHHDNGIKKFMGEEGNFNGEDIIAIVLKNKQCAKFITKKFIASLLTLLLMSKELRNWEIIFLNQDMTLKGSCGIFFYRIGFMTKKI